MKEFLLFKPLGIYDGRYGPQGFDLENSTSYKDWQKRYWKFDNSLGRRQWGILRFQATGEDEPIA